MRNPLEARVGGSGPVVTIDLIGGLTVLADETLAGAYREATVRGAECLILNFGEIDFMDSAGISLVIGVLTQSRQANQRLLCVGLSPHYRKIFTMMGIDRYAPLFNTMDDALAAV